MLTDATIPVTALPAMALRIGPDAPDLASKALLCEPKRFASYASEPLQATRRVRIHRINQTGLQRVQQHDAVLVEQLLVTFD